MDEQIAKIMELLECTEEQAKQVIADDKAIDKGEKLFELTAEQKAVAKKYKNTPNHKTTGTYSLTKRERKADNDKQELINLLYNALIENDNPKFTELPKVEITNKERQIDFEYGGRKFRIVLSAPRS